MWDFNMNLDWGGVIGAGIGALASGAAVVYTLNETAKQQRKDANSQIELLRKAIIVEVKQIGIELIKFNLVSSTTPIGIGISKRQFFNSIRSEVAEPVIVSSVLPKLGSFSQDEAVRLINFYYGITRLRKCLFRARNATSVHEFDLTIAEIHEEFKFASAQVGILLELMAPDVMTPSRDDIPMKKTMSILSNLGPSLWWTTQENIPW